MKNLILSLILFASMIAGCTGKYADGTPTDSKSGPVDSSKKTETTTDTAADSTHRLQQK